MIILLMVLGLIAGFIVVCMAAKYWYVPATIIGAILLVHFPGFIIFCAILFAFPVWVLVAKSREDN